MDSTSKSPEQISDTLAELCGAGRLDEAQVIAKQALTNYPDNPQLLSDTGVIAFQRGDSDRAALYFEQATNLAPDSSEFLRNYLASLDQISDYEKIAAKSQEILRHFGDQIEILKSSALACRTAGSDDKFFHFLYRIHELQPRERDHLEAIAAYAAIRGRATDQLFAVERLHKLLPNDLDVLLNCFHLSNILGRAADRDRYRELIQPAVETDDRFVAEFMEMLLNITARIGVLPTSKARLR